MPNTYFFGRVGNDRCRVEITVENGKVYPVAKGTVSRSLEEACRTIHGRTMTFSEAFSLLKTLM